MKPAINKYYLEVIDDMIIAIKNSEAGKRIWTKCQVTGYCDYSHTRRSTYPEWCKFYYVRTPKKKKMYYLLSQDVKPFEDGFFNGATKDLIRIMERYKKGFCSKSKRVRIVFETCVEGYMEEIRDWEYQHREQYFK